MSHWDLAPPEQPPHLTAEQAIEIALSDPLTSPELRGLPVTAEYGIYYGTRGGASLDSWKVMVDVSSLGWDMQYEGPARSIMHGEVLGASYVWVPKVQAVVIIVDDKGGRRAVSGTQPDSDRPPQVEWRRSGDAPRRRAHRTLDEPLRLWRYTLRLREREFPLVVYRSTHGYEAIVDGNWPDPGGYVAYRTARAALEAAKEYVLTTEPGARVHEIEEIPQEPAARDHGKRSQSS